MVEKQFSVRLTDDQRTQLNENFPDALQKEILDKLLNKYNERPDNSHFTDKITELEKENENLKDKLDCSNADNLQIIDLQQKNTELESRLAETMAKLVAVPVPTGERELRFTVPPLAFALLQEYAKRLETDPQNILIDMFLRYVVEQRNHWFFDFAVRKSEFLSITGYSYGDVEKWLKTQI